MNGSPITYLFFILFFSLFFFAELYFFSNYVPITYRYNLSSRKYLFTFLNQYSRFKEVYPLKRELERHPIHVPFLHPVTVGRTRAALHCKKKKEMNLLCLHVALEKRRMEPFCKEQLLVAHIRKFSCTLC